MLETTKRQIVIVYILMDVPKNIMILKVLDFLATGWSSMDIADKGMLNSCKSHNMKLKLVLQSRQMTWPKAISKEIRTLSCCLARNEHLKEAKDSCDGLRSWVG